MKKNRSLLIGKLCILIWIRYCLRIYYFYGCISVEFDQIFLLSFLPRSRNKLSSLLNERLGARADILCRWLIWKCDWWIWISRPKTKITRRCRMINWQRCDSCIFFASSPCANRFLNLGTFNVSISSTKKAEQTNKFEFKIDIYFIICIRNFTIFRRFRKDFILIFYLVLVWVAEKLKVNSCIFKLTGIFLITTNLELVLTKRQT